MEIMGQQLDEAFSELGILAVKVHETTATKPNSPYQVWKLNEQEKEKLNNVSEKEWKEDYGWWRSGKCIYEGTASVEYIVNGEIMQGYETELQIPLSSEFTSYTHWLSEVMNLSTEKNVVIFAESLAGDNGLSLSEFIKKYQG